MVERSAPSGTAWMCDLKGRIVEVVRDDLNLCFGVGKGAPLAKLVDRGSDQTMAQFLDAVLAHEVVFGRQMNVVFADRLTPLHFAGAVIDDYLMVMATLSAPEMARFNEAILSPGDAAEGGGSVPPDALWRNELVAIADEALETNGQALAFAETLDPDDRARMDAITDRWRAVADRMRALLDD